MKRYAVVFIIVVCFILSFTEIVFSAEKKGFLAKLFERKESKKQTVSDVIETTSKDTAVKKEEQASPKVADNKVSVETEATQKSSAVQIEAVEKDVSKTNGTDDWGKLGAPENQTVEKYVIKRENLDKGETAGDEDSDEWFEDLSVETENPKGIEEEISNIEKLEAEIDKTDKKELPLKREDMVEVIKRRLKIFPQIIYTISGLRAKKLDTGELEYFYDMGDGKIVKLIDLDDETLYDVYVRINNEGTRLNTERLMKQIQQHNELMRQITQQQSQDQAIRQQAATLENIRQQQANQAQQQQIIRNQQQIQQQIQANQQNTPPQNTNGTRR
ncbi:secreted protein [Candidatus Omnitrophus magneticus]|uniref:Secreted protein n=1 Tax=Candidatus Omnitrophus magneticus TaxID=1609969 RepID=A0A0F0CSE9_9BACT|nr:secreted protein [Candidatus Omnitrophus magneticus]